MRRASFTDTKPPESSAIAFCSMDIYDRPGAPIMHLTTPDSVNPRPVTSVSRKTRPVARRRRKRAQSVSEDMPFAEVWNVQSPETPQSLPKATVMMLQCRMHTASSSVFVGSSSSDEHEWFLDSWTTMMCARQWCGGRRMIGRKKICGRLISACIWNM